MYIRIKVSVSFKPKFHWKYFEKGFIKAEVIKLTDYQQYKSEQACKEAGKMSIEGKEYTVGDGDIMHFRFNV